MRVLGIESSGSRSGIAVVDGSGLLTQRVFDHEQGLLVNLAPAIESVLAELGPSSVEGIAVSIGPGSFTGLRIGVATAKSLSYAWGVPVAAVPTMDALAATVHGVLEEKDLPTVVMIRSRRGEVFGAVYSQGDDAPAAIMQVACLPVDVFLAAAANAAGQKVVVAGDAVAQYESRIRGVFPRAALVPKQFNFASPVCVARIGRGRLVSGQEDDAVKLAPQYHRRTYVHTD